MATRTKHARVSPPMIIYRVGHFFYRNGVPVLPGMLTALNRLLFSCMIPSSASLGRNVVVGYWGLGIVIHKDAVIGQDCWIMQNVTIGRKAGSIGVPTLGRNVAVGAGAIVLGGVELGDHCIIGAGSVVTKSFAAGSVVVGVPAKLLRTLDADSTTNHYLER